MKVLHIIQRFAPALGGSEDWCYKITQFTGQQGIVNIVATMNIFRMEEFHQPIALESVSTALGKEDLFGTVRVKRFDLWKLHESGLRSLFKTPWRKTQFAKLIQISPHSWKLYRCLPSLMKKTDIIHLHTLPYFHCLAGAIVAKALRKPIVITPHFHPGHPHYEIGLNYKILKLADVVITVSDFEKEYLVSKGISEDKIFITGNSVSLEDFSKSDSADEFQKSLNGRFGLGQKTKKILFLGRKELYKGIGPLVDAAKALARENPQLDVCLMMAGPDVPEFTENFPDYTAGHMLTFGNLRIVNFGAVDEETKVNLLHAADVLALPSEYEAFGIVFLEAWACKKPVIGMNIGAVPNLIKDGGLLTEQGNIDHLKENLHRLLTDEVLARDLGIQGYEKTKKFFTTDIIGERVLGVYRKIRRTKPRLLVVSDYYPPEAIGGAEIIARDQANEMLRKGFDVRILAGIPELRDRRHMTLRRHSGLPQTRICLTDDDFDHKITESRKEKVLEVFQTILDCFVPDVIHLHNFRAFGLPVLEVCRNFGIPVILTAHDYWPICPKNVLLQDDGTLCDRSDISCQKCKQSFYTEDLYPNGFSMEKRNRNFVDELNRLAAIIAPSAYLAERLQSCGLRPEKLRVIVNGINTERFRSIRKTTSGKIRFATIGIISPHKGISQLIESLSLLSKDERDKIQLTFIGTGDADFMNMCRQKIKENHLDEILSFEGYLSHDKVIAAYSRIDALIIPSVWFENCPVTMMEALASGTPVLASRLGGIPEFIKDGVNGFLHDLAYPEHLANNIRQVIRSPHVIKDMAQSCRETAEKFDLPKQTDLLLACFQELPGLKGL